MITKIGNIGHKRSESADDPDNWSSSEETVDNESQTDYDTLLEDINLDLETELKNLENAYSKSACKWPLLHQFLKG